MPDEQEEPRLDLVRPEIIAAFNAAYTLGRSDGARYGISPEGDAPDRETRRRAWLSQKVS